ncbi:hypothetical protein Bbelb_255580 [Branchiostoma belcheri]|nr:hypothetical protein Bbelb_255580 [Branchiostoma belcheri]
MDEAEFRRAMERGDVQTVRRGLQAGRDVNQRMPWGGGTALDWASWHGQTGVVELLIQHGADMEARNSYGETALHVASRRRQTGVVELLIQHGADVEANDANLVSGGQADGDGNVGWSEVNITKCKYR